MDAAAHDRCSLVRNAGASTTTSPPFDYASVAAFYATDVSGPSSVGMAQFAAFLRDTYVTAPRAATYEAFTRDVRDFMGHWDGVRSSNYVQVNAFQLVGAVRNLKTAGGYPFFDLLGRLTTLDAIDRPVDDYATFVAGFGRHASDPRSADVDAFGDFMEQRVLDRAVSVRLLTSAIAGAASCKAACGSAGGPPIADRDDTVDAFALAQAVGQVSSEGGYSGLVDVGALCRNIAEYPKPLSDLVGAPALYTALCKGTGRYTADSGYVMPVVALRDAILNTVLVDRATMAVRVFIGIALAFALPDAAAVKADRTFTALYTDGAALQLLVPRQGGVQQQSAGSDASKLTKSTLQYITTYADGTSRSGTVVIYATDPEDLAQQKDAFATDQKLAGAAVMVQWTG